MSKGDDALQALREALRLSPDNIPLRQHLADSLLNLGRPDEAEKEYRQALALAPNHQRLKIGLAQAFYQQGKNNEAWVLVEDLLKIPDTPAPVYLLSVRLLLLTSLDSPRQHLQVLAYVSATQGRRIQAGMRAEVSPTTVKREQYGYLVGRVDSVSTLPVDAETLMVQLQNKQAVQQVLEHAGVPYAVRIHLEPDPGTASGYRWSSPQGPNSPLDAGIPCTVEVTVQRQAPITLVLPFLKKEFGLD